MNNKVIKRKIPGFDHYYACSNGKIWSSHKNGYLKEEIDKDGYLRVHLSYKGKSSHHFVHRLIASCFLDNLENKEQVNHKDENKQNNCPNNLEWVSLKENINYGTGIKRRAEQRYKKVIMCDAQTHAPIKEFNSRKEAYEYCGATRDNGNIAKVINGIRQTAYGYWWKEIEV